MYNRVIEYILNVNRFKGEKDFNKLRLVLNKLGNPEEKFKFIHIAGTNGKGSVSSYLSHILVESNKKTGLFTSPHLQKINERFKIDNVDSTDEDIVEAFNKLELVIKDFMNLGFFEYMFFISLLIFEKYKVEYVVLETGIGGRLDITNIIKKPIGTIITSIDFDHQSMLGTTLEEIAEEKAGIIKENTDLVFYNKNKTICEVITKKCIEKNVKYYTLNKEFINLINFHRKYIDFSLNNGYDIDTVIIISTPALYQMINSSLAYVFCKKVLNVEEIYILEGIKNTKWAARMEEIYPNLFIDGAHNKEGINAFIENVNYMAENKKVTVVFSVLNDKDFLDIINSIFQINNLFEIKFVKLNNIRALDVNKLKIKYENKNDNLQLSVIDKLTSDDINEIKKIAETKGNMVFVVGSLYLAGEFKDMFYRKGV